MPTGACAELYPSVYREPKRNVAAIACAVIVMVPLTKLYRRSMSFRASQGGYTIIPVFVFGVSRTHYLVPGADNRLTRFLSRKVGRESVTASMYSTVSWNVLCSVFIYQRWRDNLSVSLPHARRLSSTDGVRVSAGVGKRCPPDPCCVY